MRLSRIAALCADVNRPAIDAPARCTTASTPDSRSGAGRSGFHSRSPSLRAGWRTSRITRCPPVLNNAVSAEPTSPDAPGDRDDQRCRPGLGGVAVRGQVIGELAVAVDEGGPQRRCRHGRFDAIADPGRAPVGLAELVGVPPPADHPCGPGRRTLKRQHVDEAVRRVEARGIVLSHPSQPAGKAQHRAPVGQRLRLRQHLHRLPRRHQPPHRARPGVPREHLGHRMIDDAFVFDAHAFFPLSPLTVIRSRCPARLPLIPGG